MYLTHHHFDHFHYPSLRRISKKARVLIPRFGVDVMRHELDQLGFADVTEMPHGEPMRLPGGTRVASYQYGPDDSAFVVERDRVVLADLNDCKIKGPAARPLLKAFGSPDLHVQEPFVRAGLPDLLRHQKPGRRKTDDAGGLSRDVPRRGSRAAAEVRRAVREHGRVSAS